jgi:sugar/nucleoside kinase (ribokinase family)
VSILAVGTVALDSIETPFGSADDVLGGSATYISLSARYFSDDVRLVAVVGGDFPAHYLNGIRSAGVDTDGLVIDREGLTFAWRGRYHYDMNERDTLSTDLNVLETFKPVVPESYRDSRFVCLGNLDPTLQRKVLEQVRAPELVVCDTMNYWIEHTPDALRETLKLVDCLIINDAEARELSGVPNLIRASRIIRDMGPRILVIKKGEHGALLFVNGIVFAAPAYPLEEINDPTGAGDTFAGGFVGYLSRQSHIDEDALKGAVIYGSAMASFCVERFGPERLMGLDTLEVSRRIDAFRDLTAIPTQAPVFAY